MVNQKVDYFFKSRFNVQDRYEAVRYRSNNRIDYDMEFLKAYIEPQSHVLDLGCGTGIIEERLDDLVEHITAVDKYEEFISRTIPSPKVKFIKSDVVEFVNDRKYDLIILFGVAIYLSDMECQKLYENVIAMLDKDGVFIVKNQFGINNQVIVDKYSEELQADYYAVYRYLPEVIKSLERYFNVTPIDIYPKEMNRWDNTHEYALVCTKKKL